MQCSDLGFSLSCKINSHKKIDQKSNSSSWKGHALIYYRGVNRIGKCSRAVLSDAPFWKREEINVQEREGARVWQTTVGSPDPLEQHPQRPIDCFKSTTPPWRLFFARPKTIILAWENTTYFPWRAPMSWVGLYRFQAFSYEQQRAK